MRRYRREPTSLLALSLAPFLSRKERGNKIADAICSIGPSVGLGLLVLLATGNLAAAEPARVHSVLPQTPAAISSTAHSSPNMQEIRAQLSPLRYTTLAAEIG